MARSSALVQRKGSAEVFPPPDRLRQAGLATPRGAQLVDRQEASRLNTKAAIKAQIMNFTTAPGVQTRHGRLQAVVLDLFGTLVRAPTAGERLEAASTLARCMGGAPSTVALALSVSWQIRHDGSLLRGSDVAAYLVRSCWADSATIPALTACLAELANARLRADASVLHTIRTLRANGVRVGVLSDAAADVADAWDDCELASSVDAVVFSCRFGEIKPHPALYTRVLDLLGASAAQSLYCGDGGGSELTGAHGAGMRTLRVRRRGGTTALAFGEDAWTGPTIRSVEHLPALLSSGYLR